MPEYDVGLRKAFSRNPHLRDYIDGFVSERHSTPEFKTELTRGMEDAESINVIYPIGDPLFVHIFSTKSVPISYTYDVPVSELIQQRLSLSFPLAILAIILSTVIAIPLGVLAAANHTKPLDYVVMLFSQVGIAIPKNPDNYG